MRRYIALALPLLGLSLQGCLASRVITDVVAHESYNSYKVQTLSTYYAVFSAWQEWDVWSCHKDGTTFHCAELDYDRSKDGIKRPETAAAPEAAAPAAAAEPAKEGDK